MIRESVFDTAPQNAGPSGDIFRLRNGAVIKRKPVALAYWRVTTDSADVAEYFAENYGGEQFEFDSDREPIGVQTESAVVEILIPPAGIDTGFALWDNGSLVRKCNGETQTHGDHEGERCPCADLTWDERKAAGSATCKPDILIRLRLADAPDLAEGTFRSANLNLMKDLQRVEAKVQDADSDTAASLSLVEVKMQNGKSFHKVVVKLH